MSAAPGPSDLPSLVLATRNAGKLAEFARLLQSHPWRLVDLREAGFSGELDEPGPGYAENAAFKAETVCRATGLPVLADDSGIEVLAMRGWPGPQSSRWLGAAGDSERLRELLDEVGRRSPDDRRARYVAVVALARPGAAPILAHGSCRGRLVEPAGSAGFGYDPAFLSDDLGVTFGQADAAAKDRVSHRGRAVARLAQSGLLDPPIATSP